MLIDRELFDEFFKGDSDSNFINIDINTFDEFNELLAKGDIKNNRHKTFAFSYYCLVSYLWKYSKYGKQEINTQDIKRILHVNPSEKRMNYLIKKNGVLDLFGFTETTRDFPISTTFDDSNIITVKTLKNVREDLAKSFLEQYNNRYTCKKPLLQYSRGSKVGLMFSKDDVIPITIFELTRTLLCPDISFDGFYVYVYIKYRCKMVAYDSINIFYEELERNIGYKKRRIRELINNLELAGMLKVDSKYCYCDKRISRKNSYKIIMPLNQGS